MAVNTTSAALAAALSAEGPLADYEERLMLYGQFVGEWDFTWTGYDDDGAPVVTEQGEWIFGWVLEGRAVQDVWIIPSRERRGEPGAPQGEYGTTIRVYDPAIDAWRVTWNGPVNGIRRTFFARQVGDEIVQEGETEDGKPLRWIFSRITATSFHWRSVAVVSGGHTRLREEMDVRRKASTE
jgi:hypothetical protein